MTTLFFILLVVATFAALGRGGTPKHERLPLASWRFGDVAANARRGLRLVTPDRGRMNHILDGVAARA